MTIAQILLFLRFGAGFAWSVPPVPASTIHFDFMYYFKLLAINNW
jgi:hypothetical protein